MHCGIRASVRLAPAESYVRVDLRWAQCKSQKSRATEQMVAMASQLRLKTSIPALYDKPEGGWVTVKLPAGAMLNESSAHSSTLLGLVGVYWEGRHYSVALSDLLHKADRVQTA